MKLKTKKYTKRQIREAIDFWTRILENTSSFLDALVDEYGYDPVFNSTKKMQVRLKDIERIHRIANSAIFNDVLANIDVIEDGNGEKTMNGAFIVYGFMVYFDDATKRWKLLSEEGIDSNGNVFPPPQLYVSPSFLNSQMPLVEIASIVVHEMIHQKISENASSDRLKQLASSNYDSHDSEFETLMHKINAKHGLNIQPYGTSSFRQDSINALKKFAGNDYKKMQEMEGENLRTTRVSKLGNGFIEVVMQ